MNELVFPINHKIKWTNDELNQLLQETNNKLDINIIAKNHKRTVGAIKFKLIRYAAKLINDEPSNTSFKHIQKLTNLSRKELLEGFEKIKYNYIEIKDNMFINNIYYIINIFHMVFIYFSYYNLLIVFFDGFISAQ